MKRLLEAAKGFSKREAWIVAGLCVSFVFVVGAFGYLWKYKTTPGTAAETPSRWPTESRLERSPDVPTLVMFAHPMCPCTRASLAEFRVLMSQFDGRVTPYVLLALPEGVGPEWAESPLRSGAESIPGVRVREDKSEAEARLFGAKTSGYLVLYDKDGRLLFSGGITSSRGHVGDNAGLDRVASLLDGRSTTRSGSPVFGCPLESPE